MRFVSSLTCSGSRASRSTFSAAWRTVSRGLTGPAPGFGGGAEDGVDGRSGGVCVTGRGGGWAPAGRNGWRVGSGIEGDCGAGRLGGDEMGGWAGPAVAAGREGGTGCGCGGDGGRVGARSVSGASSGSLRPNRPRPTVRNLVVSAFFLMSLRTEVATISSGFWLVVSQGPCWSMRIVRSRAVSGRPAVRRASSAASRVVIRD